MTTARRGDSRRAVSPAPCWLCPALVTTRSSSSLREQLRAAVDTPVKIRVRALVIGDGQIHVGSIGAVLEECSRGEHLVLRASVDANESPHVSQSKAAAELPERFLAEEQVERG